MSLIYFRRVFPMPSANALPRATTVQDMYGGTVHAHTPTVAERTLVEAVRARARSDDPCPGRPGEHAGHPALMELEAIEPELFLGATSDAAGSELRRRTIPARGGAGPRIVLERGATDRPSHAPAARAFCPRAHLPGRGLLSSRPFHRKFLRTPYADEHRPPDPRTPRPGQDRRLRHRSHQPRRGRGPYRRPGLRARVRPRTTRSRRSPARAARPPLPRRGLRRHQHHPCSTTRSSRRAS